LRDAPRHADRASPLRLLRWRPADAVAFVVMTCAIAAVLVNALLIQPASHRGSVLTGAAAPAKPASLADQPAVTPRPRQVDTPHASTTTPRAPAAAIKSATAGLPVARSSSIASATAERPVPSKRVIAVQRALAEFGYGQIKPSGTVDAETQAAIQKFERERKLPITGQASERVLRELAAMTGRSLE
jgi:putative peptidoglycan binding protein